MELGVFAQLSSSISEVVSLLTAAHANIDEGSYLVTDAGPTTLWVPTHPSRQDFGLTSMEEEGDLLISPTHSSRRQH